MWCELYLKAVKRRSNVNEQVEIQCLTVLKNLNLCRLKQIQKKRKWKDKQPTQRRYLHHISNEGLLNFKVNNANKNRTNYTFHMENRHVT